MTGIVAALAPLASAAAGDYIGLVNTTATDTNHGGTASASIAVNSTGTVTGTNVSTYDWVLPHANAGNYEIRATIFSGTLTSGTTGTWLALSASRTWNKQSTGTDATCVLTMELRIAATGLIVKTVTFTLNALGSP